ncbi:hypothetical protein CMI37_15070 [Candidatus Pacearchaeota archaeon]|nr:hypothetical protein [Candidatus Pacearchaeota archaeon]
MADLSTFDLDDNIVVGIYDPLEDVKKEVLVPKQLYPAHIVEVNRREVMVKNKYKALVYNCRVEVASECADKTYTAKDGRIINGENYVGRLVKMKGIFMFLSPQNGDSFKANTGANKEYLDFCNAIGHEPEKISVDVNGEKREVIQFPVLSDDDIKGKPLMAFVDDYKWKNRDGEWVTTSNVKGWQSWKDGGLKIDDNNDDIPF